MTDSISSGDEHMGPSRRDLFRTAAIAAGGAVLLGWPKLVGQWVGEAEAAMQAMTASNLFLELDRSVVCLLRSAEGGNAFAEILLEPPGPDLIARKRPGPPRFEDLVISFSPSGFLVDASRHDRHYDRIRRRGNPACGGRGRGQATESDGETAMTRNGVNYRSKVKTLPQKALARF
jgi:hypothetical protein